MESIIEEFMVETKEIVNALDANLVKLEREPNNLDLLNEIFRGAHTMKGAAGFLGFNELMKLTHKMEDILNKLRKAELTVTPEVMDILLESVDFVKATLQDITDKAQGRTDTSGIIGKLESLAAEKAPTSGETAKPVKATPAPPSQAAETKQEPPEINPPVKADQTSQQQQTQKQNAAVAPQAASGKKGDSTIRVDVDRLDNLVNMVGELVLGRNALMQTLSVIQRDHDGEKSVDQLAQASAQVNFITTELHMAIMKMRMLPIGNVFNKFPRMVRDLSREMKKQVDLIIEGEETELDKSVLEEISDPLMHLIRNSVDHGLETPEERKAKGKPERGMVKLAAFQEGNNIVIEVIDDGRGMDIEAIKKKAIERNITTPEELSKLTDKEILSFIFLPGFSTAKKISDVSGRGVGMDVVRTNIEKLKGTIELSTEKDKGSKITIKLPLTLAIVQGLLVSCGDDIFAIPLTSVIETVVVTPQQIRYINNKPVIKLRDTILPIVDMMSLLFNQKMKERRQFNVVVVGLAEKKLGLVVDSLIGQEEVVIKSIGEYLGHVPGVAGATIMGDGRVRLIIDLASLFELVLKK
ncbi:MAG: chemotaxis protein CheA [candidate division Zixibacteria bacterium]|nr:chemotaxis protein CheA [candidate division Zixibacteria bacterium]